LHGGATPSKDENPDVGAPEGNDHAAGNPGGGAPELNTNARIHDGFADWRKAYERFDDETREYVDRLAADMQETAAEHAPEVSADRRERLAKEKATRGVLADRADADVWCDLDGSGPGRGIVVESEREHNGETYTVERMNPAWRGCVTHRNREFEIARKLKLWPGFR
jgi:hypothetical protein